MMDKETIQHHLSDLNLGLKDADQRRQKAEQERDIIRSLINDYEALLRLHTEAQVSSRQLPLKPSVNRENRFGVKGSISLSDAVLKALEDAGGEVLSAAEIWRRAQLLGAVSLSIDPVNNAGAVAARLQQRFPDRIAKSGQRSWRWIGPISIETSTAETSPAMKHYEEERTGDEEKNSPDVVP